MRFKITFKQGLVEVAEIKGNQVLPLGVDISDIDAERVIDVEQYLGRLLGLRVHITQVYNEE